jgi:cyanophycinase
MFKKIYICIIVLFNYSLSAQNLTTSGSLFIIGGGHRSPQLMKTLLDVAHLKTKDYIVVLPMASEQTDTAFYYIKISLETLCPNTIINLDFSKGISWNQQKIDSLKNAGLIFIAGGDQSRFMNSIENTPVANAIKYAYNKGSTIAGTSAGAAVMNEFMITGNELTGDTTYHETYKKIRYNNMEIKPGLGLISTAIIDQHFIVRSRYNRLLSALARFPKLTCIGIDEATAIIVKGYQIKVTGESQVVVLKSPQGIKIEPGGLITFKNIEMSIYKSGDTFSLN